MKLTNENDQDTVESTVATIVSGEQFSHFMIKQQIFSDSELIFVSTKAITIKYLKTMTFHEIPVLRN